MASPAALEEFARQRAAIAASAEPGRLRLLIAAESAGALIAEELRAAGLPWDAAAHDRILVDTLGERPAGGGAPAKLAAAAERVRAALGDPSASLDSQPKLLRALHRAGVLVESTSRWELAEQRHPVIEPLLEYKKLSRLQSANGWTWLAEWVRDGRFRPVYVPGGVVTGRWASSGGGALSCLGSCARRCAPIRAGCSSSPMSPSSSPGCSPRWPATERSPMPRAGRDLYAGIVDSGAVATRSEAKIAILGAMYGATTGESGRLVPRLRRTYPARDGRSSTTPRASARTAGSSRPGSGARPRRRPRGGPSPSPVRPRPRHPVRRRPAPVARRAIAGGSPATSSCRGPPRSGRSRGSPDLRTRLAALPPVARGRMPPTGPGPVFGRRPHLAFFLHDEVIVHTPAALRRRGRAGGAGGRGIRRASALRRLPDRLPARRPHRASPRSRTEPEQAPRRRG